MRMPGPGKDKRGIDFTLADELWVAFYIFGGGILLVMIGIGIAILVAALT